MRSTRATAAVERLNARSIGQRYSMVRTAEALFYLVQNAGMAPPMRVSEAMELDEFVKFVNAYGPQKPQRVRKLDVIFEKQLVKPEKAP